MEMIEEIDNSTIVEDLNISLSVKDLHGNRRLKNTMNQLDSYKTLPSTEYTFFSSTHEMFARINHVRP